MINRITEIIFNPQLLRNYNRIPSVCSKNNNSITSRVPDSKNYYFPKVSPRLTTRAQQLFVNSHKTLSGIFRLLFTEFIHFLP